MDNFKSSDIDSQLNELSLKKLRICEYYITLMKSIEAKLDDFRFNLSKTKTIIGHNLACTTMMDLRNLNPAVKIFVNQLKNDDINDNDNDQQLFVLEVSHDKKIKEIELRKRVNINNDNKDELSDDDEEKLTSTVFRPFGLLEPQSAKHARKSMTTVLPLLCDLANFKNQINSLNKEINKICLENSIKTKLIIS